MAPMNPSQARVVDPVLTTHAQGYTNPDRIGHLILPYATIATRGAQRIHFNKRSFRQMNTRRAPGGAYQRINVGFGVGTVSLIQDALEATVPQETGEEAMKVPGLDLSKIAVEDVQDIISLGREIDVANIVMDANRYDADSKITLSGSDVWDDPASKPGEVIDEAKEKIRSRIGRKPNTLTLSPKKFIGLKNNEAIKSQFKYTSSDSITTEMLAKYFDIEKVMVGEAVYLPEDAGDDADAIDVWGTGAQLSYVARGNNYRVPSYGYTYRLKGSPSVKKAYWDETCDSWVHKVKEEWQADVTCQEAAFLIL